jgi:DNA polymerase-3 subunit alpha
MLSDNPLRYKKDLLDKFKVVSIADISSSIGYINIAGIVSSIKVIKSKKNNTSMAFMKVFDEDGEIEVVVFAKVYERVFSLLEKNNILLINGRYDQKEDKDSFIANEIKLLEE